jgi:hypothetical protein
MHSGLQLEDGHPCHSCWELQEATLENDLEEITAHEDPGGRFITITITITITISGVGGSIERYPIDAPMTKYDLEARGLDRR